MTAGWIVVIPVKGTGLAKSRLEVAEPGRGALALAFALDTVAAAVAAPAVAEVIVVTASEELQTMMGGLGAHTVRERPASGLNPAIEQGIAAAAARHPAAPVAVLLGDLPALAPAELSAVLERAAEHPRAMVPDAAGVGTVLVTAAPGIHHTVRFGGSSRTAHRAAGYVELEVDPAAGLRQDVDTVADLAAVAASALGAATAALLAGVR